MKWLQTLFERWRTLQVREDAIWRESAGLPAVDPGDDSEADCGTSEAQGSSRSAPSRGEAAPDLASLVKQRQQESENRGEQ